MPSTMEERGEEISRTCPRVREEEGGGGDEGYWVRRMTWERGWVENAAVLRCYYLPYTVTVPSAHTPHTRCGEFVPLMHDPESWKESYTYVMLYGGSLIPRVASIAG